jgi:serine/threonine-protein kinase RsbW
MFSCRPLCCEDSAPAVSLPKDWRHRAVRKPSDLPTLLDEVARAMAADRYTEKDVFGVRLALEEAVVNSLKHGHGYDPTKEVRVRFHVDRQRVLMEVEDQGPGFDPEEVPDPRAEENLERSCGRGVYLMRHYMTWLRYNDRGNRVTLCKCRTPERR